MRKDNMNLLQRVIAEYKKVTWAPKSTVFQVTVIVLLITLFVAVMVLCFDFAFGYVINSIQTLLKQVI